MYHRVLALLAALTSYYRWFLDSPIKSTMPIFTEWLIPEALGLHTEVWVRAGASLEGTGFHRRYKLELGVAEKEPQNWDLARIEVSWRVPRGFFVDPWQLERDRRAGFVAGETADVWLQWNTDDIKPAIDLEVPAYNVRAQDFTLKASLFVKKHDYLAKQYAVLLHATRPQCAVDGTRPLRYPSCSYDTSSRRAETPRPGRPSSSSRSLG
jgi:hypothetical protein